MKPTPADPRTAKQKRIDWKNSQEEWSSDRKCHSDGDCQYVTKNEYCEAKDSYLARKAKEDAIDFDTYEGWSIKHFVDSYRTESENDNAFNLAKPECFSLYDENAKKHAALSNRVREAKQALDKKQLFNGKEKKEYQIARHDLAIANISKAHWVSYAEMAELLSASDSEAWVHEYTPNYLYSMSILYKIFEARGIEPSPEEEEKLKYEILEKEVRKVLESTYSCNIGNYNNKHNYIPHDEYVFPDIVEIYLGMSDCISKNKREEWILATREYNDFYIVLPDDKGKLFRYTRSNALSVWNFFKKENLRSLLFIADQPEVLQKLFAKELEKSGLDLKEINYKNMMDDANWKDYVFKEHRLTVQGGKKSPGLISPPLMMEALIDRTLSLKKRCNEIEEELGITLAESNSEYLHTLWEYNATKLQVLLMDIRRANQMREFDNKGSDNNHIEMIYRDKLWKAQLGKYAEGWLHSDYKIADEYIETITDLRPTGKFTEGFYEVGMYFSPKPICDDYSKKGGWQTSKEAYDRKCEIAKELKRINKLLSIIGEYSPNYNDGYPFLCPDVYDGNNKESSGSSLIEHDYTTSLLREKNLKYDEGNNTEALAKDRSIGLECNAFKQGIIRFDRDYLEKQKRAILSLKGEKGREHAVQKSFVQSSAGKDLKDELADIMSKGVSAETLREMLSELENGKE